VVKKISQEQCTTTTTKGVTRVPTAPRQWCRPQKQHTQLRCPFVWGILGLLVTNHNNKGKDYVPKWVHGHFDICKVDSFWFDGNFHRIVDDTLYTNNNSDSGHYQG
jgi:hypothetical protein